MVAAFLGFVLAVDGIPVAQMANIVAERLDRLNRLVVDVDVQVYLASQSAAHDDPSNWDGPYPPGTGARRRLTVVRPLALEESWRNEQDVGSAFAFSPGRTVTRLRRADHPHTLFSVQEDVVNSVCYTTVPTLTMFDVQVHESLVPGLNTLRLLRDYPTTELIQSNGALHTYRTQLSVECFGDTWTELHEFEVDSAGTLFRHRLRREKPEFWFEREFRVFSTIEVNGAAVPDHFVAISRNSVTDNSAIHSFTVSGASVDEALAASDVQIEPERRNSTIQLTRADLSQLRESFDENGGLIASSAWQTSRDVLRKSILPASTLCAMAAAVGLALVRRRRANLA